VQFNLVLWRRILAVTGLLAILLAGNAAPASANGADPGVVPPPARPYGSTYAEWSARWWQWALAIPDARNPLKDGSDCLHVAEEQSGPVWFLGGAIDESINAERNCSVPAGKALFFPVINVECSTLEAPPFYGADGDALRTCVDGFTLADAYAEIDGVAVRGLARYFVQSPVFDFTLPPDNVLGLPEGTGSSVSNGIYLLLPPLSAGAHVIRFGGTYPDFDFSIAITYRLSIGK
jgi:hypothetical protein